MASVGAELSTLRDLNKTFSTSADDADHMKSQVDGGVHNAVWTGKYSDDFRQAWQDYRKNLDTLATALRGAADDVKTNHNNIAAATGEADRL